ncbi:MAG: DNA-directed RNA polymerase [Candidatus Aenigmarchaeota archaeon CG_4_10_14_0_8_um_filter_37_24]|nr:DNA-directed RNA polymerase [Candidatus Aenigmarchaeota archaeon]OIN85437.1 MAG: DNA-directed RNA polymerase [Candidatus Aenigmarchaeota archaeon CG1_02_38_14]PIV68642.1 MAG: DNA-directed RNA polymerase [Candidatus Aenigmarchaeota archaeon CG01_land_8_20_14_3_00_37_9]PIW40920.1 MAG: DNA-directed RNA polymerase [Candidatus Aenigmarchaeota archaeon CG15_BIG_FIL_POST_REV_8_21_14_020_37_27]PIX50308.1 MAG: DNA-directed RNA polymerase [Candidatus Aenigmarchaeota archaeon CG_4_8_14_3_um_filter_37_2
MYKIATIKTKIKVPPTKFGMSLQKAIKESIADSYECRLDKRIGMGLAVTEIKEIGEGKIIAEDASIHYPVTFDILSFKPEVHEIVTGDVIDNTEFGSFIRIGPMDGLVHVSQLMNDYVSFDEKNSIFLGKESKRTLKEGDPVRGKVISVAMMPGKENKIGLTMRQHNLGAFSWIEDEKKKFRKVLKETPSKKK